MAQCELLIMVTFPQNYKWVWNEVMSVCVFGLYATSLTEAVPRKSDGNNDT